MNKDNFRDYTMDAFRFYALCGKPSELHIRNLRGNLPARCDGSLEDLEGVANLTAGSFVGTGVAAQTA